MCKYYITYDIETLIYGEVFYPYSIGYGVFSYGHCIKYYDFYLEDCNYDGEASIKASVLVMLGDFFTSLQKTIVRYSNVSHNNVHDISIYDHNGGMFDKHYILSQMYKYFHSVDLVTTKKYKVSDCEYEFTEIDQEHTHSDLSAQSVGEISFITTKMKKGMYIYTVTWKDFYKITRLSLNELCNVLEGTRGKYYIPYRFITIDKIHKVYKDENFPSLQEFNVDAVTISSHAYNGIKTSSKSIYDIKYEVRKYMKQDIYLLGSLINKMDIIASTNYKIEIYGIYTNAHLSRATYRKGIAELYRESIIKLEKKKLISNSDAHIADFKQNTQKINAMNYYLLNKSTKFPIHTIGATDAKFIKKSYYSGRCEILRHASSEYNINVYDSNSLYPYVMSCGYKFPNYKLGSEHEYYQHINNTQVLSEYLESIILNHDSISDFYKNGKYSYLHYCDVTLQCMDITNKALCTLFRIRDGVVHPRGIFRTTIFESDLLMAMKYNKVSIIELHECMVFTTKSGIFTKFIENISELKINAEKQDNGPLRFFAKLVMNSLYGSTGLHIDDAVWIEKEDLVDGSDYLKVVQCGEKKLYLAKSDSIKLETKKMAKNYIKHQNNMMYTHVASSITAYGRLHMLEIIYKYVDVDDFYYMDTDSLHISSTLPDHLLDKYKLGLFKLEHRNIKGTYLRKKTYMLERLNKDAIVKIAGFVQSEAEIFTKEYVSRQLPPVVPNTNPSRARINTEIRRDVERENKEMIKLNEQIDEKERLRFIHSKPIFPPAFKQALSGIPVQLQAKQNWVKVNGGHILKNKTYNLSMDTHTRRNTRRYKTEPLVVVDYTLPDAEIHKEKLSFTFEESDIIST